MTESDSLSTSDTAQAKVYGTSWCPQSHATREFLDDYQIPYSFVDIDRDSAGEQIVLTTNNGYRSVPTILFSDGTTLTEPPLRDLAAKLGI